MRGNRGRLRGNEEVSNKCSLLVISLFAPPAKELFTYDDDEAVVVVVVVVVTDDDVVDVDSSNSDFISGFFSD